MEEETKYVKCPYCDCEIRSIKQFPLAQITSFGYLPLPNLIKGPIEDILPMQKTQRRFFRKVIIQNPQIPEEVMQGLDRDRLWEVSYQGRVYERKILFLGDPNMEDFFKCHPNATMKDYERLINPLYFGRGPLIYTDPTSGVERVMWQSREGVRIYADLTSDVKRFLSERERALKTLEETVGKTVPTKDLFNLLLINNKTVTGLREFSFAIDEPNLGECVLRVDSARQSEDIHLGFGFGTYYIPGFSLGIAKFAYKGLFRER